MKEVLDYRKWFEFQLEYQKTGEEKELTDRTFFTFSGGERQWQCMFHYSLQLRQNMKGQVMHQNDL
ncbi:MAG: SbcC/MukB-like Walker B domain-containing protein [Anaerostipes hadrus]